MVQRLGEFDLIDTFAAGTPRRPDRVALGIQDDGAILRPSTSPLVAVCDTLNEGVHFRPEWSSPRDVGYKAIIVNVSDLAAMGATADVALLALSVPPGADGALLAGVRDGVLEACREWSLELVGGDTTRSIAGLSLTVTLLGRVEAPLLRSAAHPGDSLVVTGALGLSGLGLALLERGEVGRFPEGRPAAPAVMDAVAAALDRYRRGVARLQVGQWLAAAGVRAAIDISDGLVQDVSHVACQSGCAVELWWESLPLAPGMLDVVALCSPPGSGVGVEHTARTMAAASGEDFELAFAAPAELCVPAHVLGVPLTVVGRFVDGPAGVVHVLAGDGSAVPLARGGWTHF